MINTRDPKVQQAIKGIHQAMEQKLRQAGRVNDKIVRESRILSILVRNPEAAPTDCARQMCAQYGDDMNADQVIRSFGYLAIRNPVERAALMKWAIKVAAMFAGAISGNRKDMDAFNEARKDYIFKPLIESMHDKRRGLHERVLAISLFEMYPELNVLGDKESLMQLGNVYACFFLYDLVDAVSEAYGFPKFEKSEKLPRKDFAPRLTLEQAMARIHQLEEAVERTNNMLQDLQNDFDEQLENSKVIELTDFFAQLNSDKYGNILDQLLATHKGVELLRKNGFELPLEINGLLIMVAKLTQFVRDTHINPVVRTDAVLCVKASEIESYEYEGTPFISHDEQKHVCVLSPGWVFKDKEVMISRPKVREVEER